MTSQSDRIQSLVDQINTILHDASVEGEPMVDEYQVLAQTRQRLIQLQGPSLPPMMSASVGSTETAIAVQDWSAPAPALAESAQQVLQSIVQEMAYLRMNTVQPLREEIVRLQQERNYLASEVQQLQHQRYQLVLAQQTDQQQMINGFLHALMERLQEQLALQVAQTITKLEGRTGTSLVSAGDAKVMQLDSTLQVVFDSLQSNINIHQAALEASLQKMQGLGQQGEAMFTAFVNRLASRLGQEASQYLQPGPSGEPVFNPGVMSGEASGAGTSAFASMGLEDSSYELSDLPLSASPVSPLSQPIVAVQADGEDGYGGAADEITLDETRFDAAFAMPEAEAFMADEVTADWQEGSDDQSLDQVIDQVIDDLESEAIAPLDALEVVDNLDLGFGLEAVELADVPVDQAELSALLQEPGVFSSVLEQGDLSLDVLAQNDPDPTVLGEEGIDEPHNNDDMSPIVLSPPEGLAAPLRPITTLQLDNDDIDVDRLLNVINASSNQADDRLADDGGAAADDLTTEVENLAESGPDDVFLLRQELAAELQDELIDEQLFGSSEAIPLPEDILPAADALPSMSQSESSISFMINAPRAATEPEGIVDESTVHGDALDPSTAGVPDQDSPDFYGAFVDSLDPSYPSGLEADAEEDTATMAVVSDPANEWEFPSDSDASTPDIGADRTSNGEPPAADDGISDSWSQWIDDAEVSTSTLPGLDESDDANLSAWLESDAPEAPTDDLSSVADIIHRLTDLAQPSSTGVEPEADELGSDPWSDQDMEASPSSEATLQDHDWMEPATDLFGAEPVSSDPDAVGDSPDVLFGDLEGDRSGAEPDADTEDSTSVGSLLDDFFSSDSPTDDPPAPAQAIAKPIGSALISDPATGVDSPDKAESLFDQFDQPEAEVDRTPLFAESSETDPLDRLQDSIGDFGSEFISDFLDESDASEQALPLFDQFDQPVNPPDAEADGVSLFAESSEELPLDLLQDGMGEQAGDDGFASLLEGLQEDDPISGALTDADEAKTLADLLRSQNTYSGQSSAPLESEESRAVPPAVPSDSDPFSNWFGSEGEDADELGEAQKKNNG